MDSTTTNAQSSALWYHRDHISHFPVELMINIFEYIDHQDLRVCAVVNKLFYSILNPKSPISKHCWRGYRQRLGISIDPAIFDLTEAQFLRKLDNNRHTCDFCKCFTFARRIWMFHGYRMCIECAEEKAVRKQSLADSMDYRQYSFLPEVHMIFRNRQHFGYESDSDEEEYSEEETDHEEIENNTVVDCVFVGDIIGDHIPKIEIEQLVKKKAAVENAAMAISCLNFKGDVERYKFLMRAQYESNVYKWLLYKYPYLTDAELQLLPELEAELEKKTSIEIIEERQHLETVTMEGVQKRFEMFVTTRFKSAFASSCRPKYEFEHWKMYDPFWKDGLLARSTLPSSAEIVAEMEKHVVAFQKHFELIQQRFLMMFEYAHDLPMEKINALMTTEAFEKVREKEFAEQCCSFRKAVELERDLARWKEKHGVAEIKIPSLVKEIESDPDFTENNGEAAFIALLNRIKAKQAELIERAELHIRKQCDDDNVYNLLMAESISSAFLEFLKQRSSKLEGYKWRRLRLIDLLPLFKCGKCDKLFTDFDSAMAHIEDTDLLLVCKEWLKRSEIGSQWLQSRSALGLGIEEKILAIRTFPNWGNLTNAAFLNFQSHLQECKSAFSHPREEYDELVDDLKGYWPELFNPGNEEKLEKHIRELLAIPASQRSDKTKEMFILSRVDEMLNERAVGFRNPRFLSDCIRKQFKCSFIAKILQVQQVNIDAMLISALDEMVRSWKVVDDLANGMFDEMMGTIFEHAFGNLFYDGEDAPVIEGEVKAFFEKVVQVYPQTRATALAAVKEMAAVKCNLPTDIFDGREHLPIFCWERGNSWIRCSLIDLVNQYLLIVEEDDEDEYRDDGDDGDDDVVIDEFIRFRFVKIIGKFFAIGN